MDDREKTGRDLATRGEAKAFTMDLPPPPTDEEVARMARKLGAPIPPAKTREEVERA